MKAVVVALVAVAALAGCGSSSEVSTNPCDYVSAADVGPAVGGPVSAGHLFVSQGTNWNGALSCGFQPQSSFTVAIPGSNAEFLLAEVTFLDSATYGRLISPSPFQSVHSVSGYGDEAYEAGAPHYEMLFVRKGDFNVAFEVAAGLGSFFIPEERLARIVMPRLPA